MTAEKSNVAPLPALDSIENAALGVEEGSVEFIVTRDTSPYGMIVDDNLKGSPYDRIATSES